MDTGSSRRIPSSFRDPSGYVYLEQGLLYRRIHPSYLKQYDLLMKSGLYTELTEAGLLVPHVEVSRKPSGVVIRPERVPFISYPYEWCFSELKDAALATLRIQDIALKHGMSLKDASAFNIQFYKGHPVLIDTLSFEEYPDQKPWIAYRQFCQHFLAPLALMAHTDLRMGSLSAQYIDGIPLDLASALLPHRTKLTLGLGAHLHLHARSQRTHSDNPSAASNHGLSKSRLQALLTNLKSTVQSLKLPTQKTVWHDYYANTNYTSAGHSHKKSLVTEWIAAVKPKTVWDAGANDGTFSRIASSQGVMTVGTDIDPQAVEQGYRKMKKDGERLFVPLILDLTNPTPAIGWGSVERDSFLDRGPFDLTLCLAVVHHLAIANNLPLEDIAELFTRMTTHLLIEFVPKEDSNTKRLLAAREDIFPNYTRDGFEKAFSHLFEIKKHADIKDSCRTLYLMKRK